MQGGTIGGIAAFIGMDSAVSPRVVEPAGPLAMLRINLTYLWRHRRLPDLAAPTRFTELVQRRKLDDRDWRLPRMADKLGVKALVADRLGPEWVVPTLWAGTLLPEDCPWRAPFVVKSRHGCNQNAFVHDAAADWPAIRARAARWLDEPYGAWLDEWLYSQIDAGILIEPFIGRSSSLPIDYKFYVFGGRVAYVQVHLHREHDHRWQVLDRHWRAAGGGVAEVKVARPSALAAMIEGAEEMGRGFDFVRVDLYQPDDRPLFGEMSFYPGSGLDRFDPPDLDREMGALWLAARGRTGLAPTHAGARRPVRARA